jgi:hypothetical protein
VSDGALTSTWSAIYQADWDSDPEQYLHSGLLKWGHSRRLARFDDPRHAFKAYIGIHHSDPARWGSTDPARTRFFVSVFVRGKTSTLRTYDTLAEAREALLSAYQQRLDDTSEEASPPKYK